MSTTTTTTEQGSLRLAGGHDGGQTISSVPLSESRALPLHPPTGPNPEGWPTIRGTPHYVPYDENIDFAERPLGANRVEYTFLVFMLSGVLMTGVSCSGAGWRLTKDGEQPLAQYRWPVDGQRVQVQDRGAVVAALTQILV